MTDSSTCRAPVKLVSFNSNAFLQFSRSFKTCLTGIYFMDLTEKPSPPSTSVNKQKNTFNNKSILNPALHVKKG